MAEPLDLFILAGEASGDRIAGDLVRSLEACSSIRLSGVGGDELEAAGLQSIFPMHELSVMGWVDVLPRLPKLLWRAAQIGRHIARTRPDIAVFVDAQVFSAVAARSARRRGFEGPIVLYVAPAVWAWKPERARALRGVFDEVLAVLPFEPAVMQRLDGPPTFYVGHPAVKRFKQRQSACERGPLLLLPGSREGELRRHLDLMRTVATRFAEHPRVSGFALPTPGVLRDRVARQTASWPVPVEVTSDEGAKQAAFGSAVAAVAVTGTVTLELALAGVPMVTTYVADEGQKKRWLKYAARFASLPNILLDRPLVPEILDIGAQPGEVGNALETLLTGDGTEAQMSGFADIRALMEHGAKDAPPVEAAERVLASAGSQRSPTTT